MASQLKEGQQVRVVDREAGPNDEKSGLFYNYFRNVTGVLEKLYDDGKASVIVDTTSLPEEIQERHRDLTIAAKQKWMDGLSQEARNRLTADEQVFNMRYTILIEVKDLIADKGLPKPAAAKASEKPKTEETVKAKPEKSKDSAISTLDLDKAEEEFLKARQSKK